MNLALREEFVHEESRGRFRRTDVIENKQVDRGFTAGRVLSPKAKGKKPKAKQQRPEKQRRSEGEGRGGKKEKSRETLEGASRAKNEKEKKARKLVPRGYYERQVRQAR